MKGLEGLVAGRSLSDGAVAVAEAGELGPAHLCGAACQGLAKILCALGMS